MVTLHRWLRAALGVTLLVGLAGCGQGAPARPAPASAGAGSTTPLDASGRPVVDTSFARRLPAETYVVEPARWGIPTDGTDAVRTTEGLQAALDWASRHGFGTVRVPAGRYLVGKVVSDTYVQGISMPGAMALELAPEAQLRMVPNDRWNSCLVLVSNRTDVVVRGGSLVGDRDGHTYTPKDGSTAHDEGHGICVWGLSSRVLVEDVDLSRFTGDGVLVVGGSTATDSAKNIVIRRTVSHGNRRQGFSLVRVDGALLEDNTISEIRGTPPQFGIDIETPPGQGSSRNIVIARSWFRDNAGGHIANFDGHNVWVEDNTMGQTAGVPQTDAPVVIHPDTDMRILRNSITMTDPTANGLKGIVTYAPARQAADTAASEVAYTIASNTCTRCGFYVHDVAPVQLVGNTVADGVVAARNVRLTLSDTTVTRASGPGYSFSEVTGTATGNLLNGQPVSIPLSDTPLTLGWTP